MCGSMSKQRYLLIACLLVLLASLNSEIALKTEMIAVTGASDLVWQNKTLVDARYQLNHNLSLGFRSRLDAADAKIKAFPQNKWLNSQLSLAYAIPHLELEAAYRNTLFGSPQRLGLYPVYNSNFEYRRTAEHQSMIEANTDLAGFKAGLYGIHRNLRVKPTEFVIDWDTFETTMVEKAAQGLDNVYGGVYAGYQVLPFLSLTAFGDVSKANFAVGNTYDLNSTGAAAGFDYKPTRTARISGSFTWTNRYYENMPSDAANLLHSQVRIQHNLLPGMYGYVSYENNSCTDTKLNSYYLISNLLRCQVQYHFSYDPASDSYLLAGVKYSPENEADAYYTEAKSLVVPHLYAGAGLKVHPDLFMQYQGRLSYYLDEFSEVYLQCLIDDQEISDGNECYLGIGSDIRF